MNLEKLFEMQKVLDEKIYARFPGLKEEDWSWKITALLVELGECANEHRGFKKWSENQQPRTKIEHLCTVCDGSGDENWPSSVEMLLEGGSANPYLKCEDCDGTGKLGETNPILEEFVDCIHFFISIAIELKINPADFIVDDDYTQPTATQTFNRVFSTASSLDVLMDPETAASISLEDLQETLHEAFSCFIGLGEKFLGFTWDQVEAAYYAKNEINHVRQAEGY
ncbi:dUTPase [Sporosarcina sp. ANT_H38]|uniref:dUTP diphosphatase n=1 Tax=Sporosarcina sp. ANT_H38 TaxID=2597358 RepID=UPI0011F1680B|nr:dUTP diphosphatase [Sporosarcina sp. ANT_H38]KAA0941596.1 dUTPase [Sporosarcina sp. ANT_H38]